MQRNAFEDSTCPIEPVEKISSISIAENCTPIIIPPPVITPTWVQKGVFKPTIPYIPPDYRPPEVILPSLWPSSWVPHDSSIVVDPPPPPPPPPDDGFESLSYNSYYGECITDSFTDDNYVSLLVHTMDAGSGWVTITGEDPFIYYNQAVFDDERTQAVKTDGRSCNGILTVNVGLGTRSGDATAILYGRQSSSSGLTIGTGVQFKINLASGDCELVIGFETVDSGSTTFKRGRYYSATLWMCGRKVVGLVNDISLAGSRDWVESDCQYHGIGKDTVDHSVVYFDSFIFCERACASDNFSSSSSSSSSISISSITDVCASPGILSVTGFSIVDPNTATIGSQTLVDLFGTEVTAADEVWGGTIGDATVYVWRDPECTPHCGGDPSYHIIGEQPSEDPDPAYSYLAQHTVVCCDLVDLVNENTFYVYADQIEPIEIVLEHE